VSIPRKTNVERDKISKNIVPKKKTPKGGREKRGEDRRPVTTWSATSKRKGKLVFTHNFT